MGFELEQRARKAIRENWSEFLKMDTLMVVNTSVISKHLHYSQKQKVETYLKQNGDYYANCELMNILCKSDRAGEYLLQAFSEIEYTGVHEKLAWIIRRALTPPSQPDTSRVPSQPDNVQLSDTSMAVQKTNDSPDSNNQSHTYVVKTVLPLQASEDETGRKILAEGAKSNVNQLSELTSAQHDNADTDSTTCNVTNQSTSAKLPCSNSDINENCSKKSEKNKEIESFLSQNQNNDGPVMVDNGEGGSLSEEMSASFVISISRGEAARNQDSCYQNEIENLKYPKEFHDDMNSQTFPKQMENGDDVGGTGNSSNCHVQTERSETSSEVKERDSYQSSNFIDIQTKKDVHLQCSNLPVQSGNKNSSHETLSTKNVVSEMKMSVKDHSSDCLMNNDCVDVEANTLLESLSTYSTYNDIPNNNKNGVNTSEMNNLNINSPETALPMDSSITNSVETDAKWERYEIKSSTKTTLPNDGMDDYGSSLEGETGIDQGKNKHLMDRKEAENSVIYPHDVVFSSPNITNDEIESGGEIEIHDSTGHALGIVFPKESINEFGAVGGCPSEKLSPTDRNDENRSENRKEIENTFTSSANNNFLLGTFQSCPEGNPTVANASLEDRNNESNEFDGHVIQRTMSMPAGEHFLGFQFMYKKCNAFKGITGSF